MLSSKSSSASRVSRTLRFALPALAAGALWASAIPVNADPPKADPLKVARKLDATDSVSRKSALLPAIDLLRTSQAEAAKLKDYTCTFTKSERVNNHLYKAVMDVKFRQEPFSVYMKFQGANVGREVLFVTGANKDKLLVKEGGFASWAGTLSFEPTAPQVMKENRYPITDFGFANLLKLTIEGWEKEVEFDEIQVRMYDARYGENDCHYVEVTHPKERPQFRYTLSRYYLDKSTKLPIHIEQYGFPARPRQNPPLVEEYTYSKIKTNVNLTDADFDRKNPAYEF